MRTASNLNPANGACVGQGWACAWDSRRQRHFNAAMAKLLKDPVILERLDKQGIEPRALSNADFGKLLAVDYKRMADVVKASGAKIE